MQETATLGPGVAGSETMADEGDCVAGWLSPGELAWHPRYNPQTTTTSCVLYKVSERRTVFRRIDYFCGFDDFHSRVRSFSSEMSCCTSSPATSPVLDPAPALVSCPTYTPRTSSLHSSAATKNNVLRVSAECPTVRCHICLL